MAVILWSNSVLVSVMVAKVKQLDYGCSVKQVYEFGTLAALAEVMEVLGDKDMARPSDPSCSSLQDYSESYAQYQRNQTQGNEKKIQHLYPLTLMQEGFLFHHRLNAEQDPYITNIELIARSEKDFTLFLDAINFLISRHDILRASFAWSGLEQPIQVIEQRGKLKIETSKLEEIVDDAQAMSKLRGQIKHKINLAQAPC